MKPNPTEKGINWKPKAGIAPETKAGLDCMEGVQRGYEGGHQSVIITTTTTISPTIIIIIIITVFVYVKETDKTNHDEGCKSVCKDGTPCRGWTTLLETGSEAGKDLGSKHFMKYSF